MAREPASRGIGSFSCFLPCSNQLEKPMALFSQLLIRFFFEAFIKKSKASYRTTAHDCPAVRYKPQRLVWGAPYSVCRWR